MKDKKSAKPKRLLIFADYHQFTVGDPTVGGAVDVTPASADDRLSVGNKIVSVHTARNVKVPVVVEVLSIAPKALAAGAQHVTECSLPAPSGVVAVNGLTSDPQDATSFTVPQGNVRIRVSHFGLDKISADGVSGKDHYHIAIWPGTAVKSRVLRRWQPQKPPKKTENPAKGGKIAPPKTFKQAVLAARQGRVDLALPKLLELSEKGDVWAAAAAVEIFAFQGNWPGVIEQAGIFLAKPESAAVNPYEEMLAFLRLAGQATGDWSVVTRAVQPLKHSDFADLAKTFLNTMKSPARPQREPAKDLKKPAATADFNFAVLNYARSMVHQGQPDAAWSEVQQALSRWHQSFIHTVAPHELLTDPLLAPMMTPQRCAQVLATPKGV